MKALLLLFPLLALPSNAASSDPIAPGDLVFEEKNGVLAVEAEHFIKQEKHDVRAWHIISATTNPSIKPDGDPSHAEGASGGAYVESLPDTRRTHDDKLINGENFSNTPGKMAILSYKVHINTPGKYYVWVRTHSTGTEDNGIHVGLDGTWPESGARMQWTAKRKWHWDSKQRTTEVHGGVEGLIWLQIDKAGEHTIQFSMREDGFEFDKFLLTTTAPPASRPEGTGPAPRVKSGKLPRPFLAAKPPTPKKPSKPGPGRKFPAHWGEPPAIQTQDYVPLPGGYGHGSSSLGKWIQQNLDKDAGKQNAKKPAAAPKPYPAHWGKPPRIQTRDYVPLPGGYGHGSSTLKKWIQQNLDKDAGKEPQQPGFGQEKPRGHLPAKAFLPGSRGYYLDKDKWLAVNPDQNKVGKASSPSPFPAGTYHFTLRTVGESDGRSNYQVAINDEKIGAFLAPLSTKPFEEGRKFNKTWKKIELNPGDVITIISTVASKDGKEFSRARVAGVSVTPANKETTQAFASWKAPSEPATAAAPVGPNLQQPRGKNGDGSVAITGELKQWHKVTLTLDGPFAHELDNKPNPFTDFDFTVTFTHESGKPSYKVPGYFAADGKAGQSSAQSGSAWRAHLSPDKPGKWSYTLTLLRAPGIAIGNTANSSPAKGLHRKTGTFTIAPTDKSGRDFRSRGRLSYVGKHHLQFVGSGEYFLKAGADAPETLLGYADFDGTEARKAQKVPLKHYKPHLKDWQDGDPTWKEGKGKGLIGALNYLASTGVNAFSFLPYNAGGDGDNVWPFVGHDDPLHYDCSKLDQWGIVLDHATAKGLFAHFKMQETENDDNNRGGHHGDKITNVPAALDGGDLGPERTLYVRELIARFGHLLALNWNLGEENTQTTKQQMDMAGLIARLDPYDHHIVIHTFPNMQEKVYRPLLGADSPFTGASLQNSNIRDCHSQIVKWTKASAKAGKPWAVAFDEPGDAQEGMPPDPDYPGMPKDYKGPTIDEVRKYVLWGTILGGGLGVEYYFGYKLPQNDLICEDWRSRDQSWRYCAIALDFFRDEKIPFQDMANHDELVGNTKHDNSAYCYAKKGLYLVYLPEGGSKELTPLPEDQLSSIQWFNPRSGELGKPAPFAGKLLAAPDKNDWLAILR